MNVNQACDPINVADGDVIEFLKNVNHINLVVEKRKRDLEKLMRESQKQLDFLNDLRNTPNWIYTYLEKDKELKEKIKSLLSNDPKSVMDDN